MRLLLSAESKNNITYLPDTLIIEAGGKTYEYDIVGEVISKQKGLDCELKGDLDIIDDGQFKEMTWNDKYQLLSLLGREDITVIINVIPADDEEDPGSDWIDSVYNDELSEGYGSIAYNGSLNMTFKFKPVFEEF